MDNNIYIFNKKITNKHFTYLLVSFFLLFFFSKYTNILFYINVPISLLIIYIALKVILMSLKNIALQYSIKKSERIIQVNDVTWIEEDGILSLPTVHINYKGIEGNFYGTTTDSSIEIQLSKDEESFFPLNYLYYYDIFLILSESFFIFLVSYLGLVKVFTL